MIQISQFLSKLALLLMLPKVNILALITW